MRYYLHLGFFILLFAAAGCRPTSPPKAPSGPGPDAALSAQVGALAQAAGMQGWLLIAQGDRVLVSRGVGTMAPGNEAGFARDQVWTLASFTKQVLAVLVMQAVERGELQLDQPVQTYLPGFASANAGSVTMRQLLRHQSGFPNPDTSPLAANGMPSFYAVTEPVPDALAFCAGPVTGPAGGAWAYNNCDYHVAVAVLEQVSGISWEAHISKLNAVLGTTFTIHSKRVPGYEGAASDEGLFDLARYKGAGDLAGTAQDILAFDRALLAGKLLSPQAREQLWDGQAALGYIALGQWAFSANIASCGREVRLIERRGATGYVELRNLLVPELDLVVIALSNRAGTTFGELWEGKGLSHDVLAAAVCRVPTAPPPGAR